MTTPKFKSFPLGLNQYFRKPTVKNQIYLHHTAGSSSSVGVAKYWNSNEDRIATQYVIAGKPKSGSTEQDGDIVECFDSQYWAYHLGLKKNLFTERGIPYKPLDKFSIGIEICCWGQLNKQPDGTFLNYVNSVVPSDEVIDLVTPFKAHRYWHNYTDAQISSLKELLLFICEKHNIKPTYNDDIFAVSNRALKGEEGIFTHNSVRSDKFDIYPHPKIIEMLKSIS
jgi:N-acetyl-anhydromuramyl-L-alanine amidase AmpD